MSARSALCVTPVDAALEPALLRLAVLPAQRAFVGRIEDLLADAQSRPTCEPMAIVLDDAPVGFYCIETVARGIAGRDFDVPALGLRGFFLAGDRQGQGLGTRALAALLADLAQRHPQARLLVLTVASGNAAALALYRRAGFADSAQRYDGGPGGPQQLWWRTLP